ncbi:hypothetical protein [Oceanobacillus kapialis]|uniref:Uncharacterized protein n=1 Tax=Oceanobacillus kapialis TaxID=481353 RepID=A0ABW5Q136_9BACI
MSKKRIGFILGISILLLLTIAGCGSDEESSGTDETNETEANEESNSESENNSETGEFTEVDSSEVEGEFDGGHFFISDDGEVLNWGEKDERIGDPTRMKVWVEGETEEVDPELASDKSSYLHSQGNVFGIVTDHDKDPEEETLNNYNPRTGDTEEYVKPAEVEEFLFVGPHFVNDKEGIILSKKDYTDGEIIINAWNYGNDTVDTYNVTEGVYDLIPEIDSPQNGAITISPDGKSFYLSYTEGIVQYDIETDEVNEISVGEELDREVNVTADNQYAITRKFVENPDYYSYSITDVDSFEQTEIGEGNQAFPLSDGRIVIQKDMELNVYDPVADESSSFYTIELGEETRLRSVQVSGDGNTIAYGYEDENEDKITIKIIRR